MRTELHIVSPAEELSDRNGSAILTVARHLANSARKEGNEAWIVGAASEKNNLSHTLELLSPLTPNMRLRLRRLLDPASKYMVGTSLTTPEIILNHHVSPTNIYCHNQPWLIPKLRRAFPNAEVELYVHNRILRGARKSTVRKILHSCNRIVCVSEYIKTDLFVRSGLSEKKAKRLFHVQNNGVDFERYNTSDSYRVPFKYDIAYVGRIVPDKGVHVLANAVRNIADSKKVSVLIVGGHSFLPGNKTPYVQSIEDLLAHEGISATITGPVPPTDIPALLNSAKLHVVPSIWEEPCALVILEGLASRACLIATSTGGTPEIVPPRNTALIAPNQFDELAATIQEYLDDPKKRDSDARNQTLWAMKRSWHSVYKGLVT